MHWRGLTSAVLILLFIVQSSGDPVVDNDHGRHATRPISEEDLDRMLETTTGSRQKRAPEARALTPSIVRTIYNIPGGDTAGSGQTVAIVVAFGASSAEADLEVYSTRFGLPSCTTANGCFKKVDQNGGNNIPRDDPTTPISSSWLGETNLDIQWVHATAPGANITLVCANSSSSSDLYPAVMTAASLADIVSLSWGGAESLQSNFERFLANASARGVSIFAATGDSGGPATYPATSPSVIAVGGTTTLTESDGIFSSESGWSGSSGGCSNFYTASEAQQASGSGTDPCGTRRAVPDISFNGDPTSGVPVYVDGSYVQFGGTSLATPIAAGRAAAVKAFTSDIRVIDSFYIYNNITLRDITSGSNQNYSAGGGFDLVTGRGVWTGDLDINTPNADENMKITHLMISETMQTKLPMSMVLNVVESTQETLSATTQTRATTSATATSMSSSALSLPAITFFSFSLFLLL
ncbi:lipoprotein [Planoprotostelium fungivorum]|uniref:Lipoprotein n=1 Tax=Planoprotostelium fungivorum TaxID=1890364 RepID=A0A2P6N2N5_9EUKA|nr:lipoprotein [Planoprotostelium fungivorum]